jgi:hypothetical protein
MQRIYYKELKKNVRILVVKDKEIMHQLLKVLRSKLGDYVAFFN